MAGLWEYLSRVCRWNMQEECKYFLKPEEDGIIVILNFSVYLPICGATFQKT
jgi:hypothetical protein